MALTAEADERRAFLAGYIAAAETGAERDRDRVYTLFSECRFGYRSALAAWRDNVAAKEGLKAATEDMIRFELDEGEPNAAAALAAQLPEVSEEVAAAIEEAARERSEHQRMLEEAREQEDQSIGRRTRIFLTFVFSVLWTLLPLAVWLFELDTGWAGTFAVPVTLVILLLGAGVWARESLSKTAFNRRVSGVVFIAFSMELPLHLGQWILGMDPAQSQVQAILLWATALAFAIVTIDRRIWPAALSTLLGYFVASWNVELRWLVMAVNAVIMLVNIAFVWRVEPDDVDAFGGIVHNNVSRFTKRPPPPAADL